VVNRFFAALAASWIVVEGKKKVKAPSDEKFPRPASSGIKSVSRNREDIQSRTPSIAENPNFSSFQVASTVVL